MNVYVKSASSEEPVQVKLPPRPIVLARVLLAEAAAMKADWLVMGAYRHNRIVEWALGGVTRTVLREARLPLFLVH